MGVGRLFVEVASVREWAHIRTNYRATSLVRGALSRVTTRSMLTSLPCGQWTVGGISDGVTFWRFWENARVGRRLGSSSRPASCGGRCWRCGLSLGGVLGVGGLFVEVAPMKAWAQIRANYRATSLDRGAFSRVTTRSMLTSLPSGQRTVCGISDGKAF